MLSVVGNNTYLIDTKMGGGTHSARRYVLESVQSEEMFINGMRLWVIYCISSPLLVVMHIPQAQKWAPGHRCSLRHNVCQALQREYKHIQFKNLSVYIIYACDIYGLYIS